MTMDMNELEERIQNIESAIQENHKLLESGKELGEANRDEIANLVKLLQMAVRQRNDPIPAP